MSIKLILVCKEGETRQAYLREAKSEGADVDVVSTYGDLFKTMLNNAYQGIMIDLVTGMKASKEDKEIVKDVLESFPNIQLKWEKESGCVRAISFGKTIGGNSLRDFIQTDCRSFKSRAIRLDVRKNLHFNVLLSMDGDMSEKGLEHTVTINVSRGGCFLFSSQDWSRTAMAWMIVKELQDKTAISGEIRWSIKWGETMSFPGIGICFKDIRQGQLQELIDRYRL